MDRVNFFLNSAHPGLCNGVWLNFLASPVEELLALECTNVLLKRAEVVKAENIPRNHLTWASRSWGSLLLSLLQLSLTKHWHIQEAVTPHRQKLESWAIHHCKGQRLQNSILHCLLCWKGNTKIASRLNHMPRIIQTSLLSLFLIIWVQQVVVLEILSTFLHHQKWIAFMTA